MRRGADASVPQDAAVPLFPPRERHWDGESTPTGSTAGCTHGTPRWPPSGSKTGLALSPTPPQGGSDTGLHKASCLIPGQDGNHVPGLWCRGCPPGSAGVPPASLSLVPLAGAEPSSGAEGSQPVAGNLNGRTKATPGAVPGQSKWRRGPGLCRTLCGGTPALPGGSLGGSCRSELCKGLRILVFICVHSWFAVPLRTLMTPVPRSTIC